jgi:hypothetical protein
MGPLTLSCLLLVTASTAWSDSFRCGRKIIRTGDSPGHVISRCGEPVFRDSGYAADPEQGNSKRVRVERWYYKRGERSLGRMVVFYRGKVMDIETTDR